MGHVRLGRLPATRKWKEIVQFLASDGFSVADLADRVMDACDKSFSAASKDPAFQKALQLLCQIPIASKQDNLSAALSEIGVSVPDNPSRTDIVVGFEKAIEKAQRDGSKNITDLSELAKQAGIAALNTLLTQPAPAPQLGFWEAPKGDTHRQLQASATPEGFGDLAQTFISNFACSNVRYYMDREMPKHLGADGMVKSISDLTLFDQGVAKHCREASFIMRAFARDWDAKKVYSEKTLPNKKDVSGFAHVIAEKMRKEFRIRNGKDARV